LKSAIPILVLTIVLCFCTKKEGKNPGLAFSDSALRDSCSLQIHPYYQNNPDTFYSGTIGPHGTFQLRFNAIAFAALIDKGKLPKLSKMPEGSLVIKDVYKNGSLYLYAFMYKRSGNWLWGEVAPNGQVFYSVNRDPQVCTGCHSQGTQRDLIQTFDAY
jgi:hypothetical protein